MTRHKTIEEAFRAIRPRHAGSANSPTLATISIAGRGSSDGFSGTFSQAGQEIAQLRAVFQTQADALKTNTEALQKSSGSGGSGIGSAAGDAAKSFLSGGIASSLPLFGAIAGLFGIGGKSSAVAPLVSYSLPPSVKIDSILSSGSTAGAPFASSSITGSGAVDKVPAPGLSQPSTSQGGTFSPQVSVHVNAMDSQSFLDRSSDIADAVRAAVLNLHPLTRVLAEL